MTHRQERLATAVVAVAVALLLHRPLLANLGHALPGEAGSDVFRAHWSLWLVAEELPRWPFGTSVVGFPNGVDLLPFPAASLLAWAPVTALAGPDIALGLLVFAYSLLAFAGASVLVRTLGGSAAGGWLAGALLATQPVLGGALRDGTLEVLAIGWLPLQLAAMVLATRGDWRWGLAAGGLFLLTCVESVYYGSFAALASLFCLTLIRSRAGLLVAGLSGVVVAVGAAGLAWAFSPVLDATSASLAGTADQVEAARTSNAATLELLKQLALAPGSRGWKVSDIWAPPLAHWLAFGLGAMLALRRHLWLTLLGVATVLMSLDHALVALWTDSPIGEVVRFPRRYLAATAVAGSALAGVGLSLLGRWPWVERLVALVAGGYLALWGAHAGGYVRAYPLVELPDVAFADALAEDGEDCALLFAPLEVPGSGDEKRQSAPVFASLGEDLASGELLFLQTRASKRSFVAPDLLTLARRPGPSGRFAKNAIDLAFASAGQSVPGSARLPPAAYEREFAWLMGEGLKYVVVDLARYPEADLETLLGALEPVAVATTQHDDGTGVLVVQLYEERPPAADPPAADEGAVPDAGDQAQGFSGRIVNMDELPRGPIVLWVEIGEGEAVRCPVMPEDGSFTCGERILGHRSAVVRATTGPYPAEIKYSGGEYKIRALTGVER